MSYPLGYPNASYKAARPGVGDVFVLLGGASNDADGADDLRAACDGEGALAEDEAACCVWLMCIMTGYPRTVKATLGRPKMAETMALLRRLLPIHYIGLS